MRVKLKGHLAKVDPLVARQAINSRSQYLIKTAVRPAELTSSFQRLPPMDRSNKTFETLSTNPHQAANNTLVQSQSSFLPPRRGLALLTEQDEDPVRQAPVDLGQYLEAPTGLAPAQPRGVHFVGRAPAKSLTSPVDYHKHLASLQQNFDSFMAKTRSKQNLYVVPRGVYPDPHHFNEFYRVDMREYARNLRGYVALSKQGYFDKYFESAPKVSTPVSQAKETSDARQKREEAKRNFVLPRIDDRNFDNFTSESNTHLHNQDQSPNEKEAADPKKSLWEGIRRRASPQPKKKPKSPKQKNKPEYHLSRLKGAGSAEKEEQSREDGKDASIRGEDPLDLSFIDRIDDHFDKQAFLRKMNSMEVVNEQAQDAEVVISLPEKPVRKTSDPLVGDSKKRKKKRAAAEDLAELGLRPKRENRIPHHAWTDKPTPLRVDRKHPFSRPTSRSPTGNM